MGLLQALLAPVVILPLLLIVAALRIAGWSLKNLAVLLNQYSSAVTAAATIVIALLTYAYVTYSRAQWGIMQGQLDLERAKARASITIEGMQVSRFPSPNYYVTFDLNNSGDLVAQDVGFNCISMLSPFTSWYSEPPIHIGPSPILARTSLAGHSKRSFRADCGDLASSPKPDTLSQILKGRLELAVFVSVAYHDNLGGQYWTTECLSYFAPFDTTFVPCQGGRGQGQQP